MAKSGDLGGGKDRNEVKQLGVDAMEKRKWLYFRGLQEGEAAAVLFADERAVMALSGNYGSRQEIGRFECRLPPGSYQRFEDLARETGFEKARSGEPPAGAATITVGHTMDEKAYDMRTYPVYELPSQLKPLLAEGDRLVEATLQHPKRVVRGSGSPEKGEYEAGGTVAFQITLKSVGRESAIIDNALGSREPDSSGIQLYIERDKPPEKMQESDQLWVDLPVRNLTVVEPKPAPSGRRVTLAPGAELVFVAKKKLLLSPGRYRASAFYHASAGKPGQEVVDGRLRIDLGTFSVVRPRT